jgi:hypothetical protein
VGEIVMKSKVKPTARKNDLVIQHFDDGVLVYDLNTNRAACLNETAAFVWQSCDGSNAIADIAQALGRKTNSAVNDDVVWLAIDELAKHKLLEDEVAAEYSFTGVSRRDVIKKIGLGTMIALPIIATLVAPQAALAAPSCGGPCTGNVDCTLAACRFCRAGNICGA